MRIESDIKYDFADVLIRPKRSEAPSRNSVDLNRKFEFLNSGQTWEGVPIIASNMVATGTFNMCNVLAEFGMLTCLHKFYSLDEIENFYQPHPSRISHFFFTIGIKDKDFQKLDQFSTDPLLICIDVANGYTKYFVDKCKVVREKYPDSIIMAGNVCTPEMVQELIFAGVDIVKIGIGPGSVCTTRIVTGVGYPQLSAIIECADAAHGLKGHVCADGGCVASGDIAKAFGAGADFVMLGSMLSGTDECEGEWETEVELIHNSSVSQGVKIAENEDGSVKYVKKCLKFYGMSSREAMEKFNDGKIEYKAAEGKCVKIPAKGPVKNVLIDIMGGLRSACTYVGTEKLKDLSKCTTFVRVNRTHNTVYS